MMLDHAFGVAIVVAATIHNTLSCAIGPIRNPVHDAVVQVNFETAVSGIVLRAVWYRSGSTRDYMRRYMRGSKKVCFPETKGQDMSGL